MNRVLIFKIPDLANGSLTAIMLHNMGIQHDFCNWGAAFNGTGTALQAVISRFESEALHNRTKIVEKYLIIMFVF